ncbi:MAG: hypothetical protein HY349_05015 [Nitrospirae bacterium]|nr:hypothetical protein [Nitrospirota bacterium]
MIRFLFFFMSFLLLSGCVGGGGAESLTSEERQKITELVLSVAEDPEETVKPAQEELWAILKQHGLPSGADLGLLKGRFLAIGEGHRLFWLDAREALQTHRMVKSPERVRWEEQLSRDGWLSSQQRVRFDSLMTQVMEEAPILSNHGVEVSLSQAMVNEIVNSWDARELERSVAYLLTPPKESNSSRPSGLR